MRRPSFVLLGIASFACVASLQQGVRAQPAGSSPEAAFEAFEGSQMARTKFVDLEEAKAQMVGPACNHAMDQQEQGAMFLEGCIHTMQDSLGWLETDAFSGCAADGIARHHLDACASAMETFLFHHQDDQGDEAQSTFSLALMKDLCAPSTLCAASPEA